jgi:hypothetical protein
MMPDLGVNDCDPRSLGGTSRVTGFSFASTEGDVGIELICEESEMPDLACYDIVSEINRKDNYTPSSGSACSAPL